MRWIRYCEESWRGGAAGHSSTKPAGRVGSKSGAVTMSREMSLIGEYRGRPHRPSEGQDEQDCPGASSAQSFALGDV
eukprot:scaffold5233_cov178-Amphora_coffeaeformis.AAC.2